MNNENDQIEKIDPDEMKLGNAIEQVVRGVATIVLYFVKEYLVNALRSLKEGKKDKKDKKGKEKTPAPEVGY